MQNFLAESEPFVNDIRKFRLMRRENFTCLPLPITGKVDQMSGLVFVREKRIVLCDSLSWYGLKRVTGFSFATRVRRENTRISLSIAIPRLYTH